MFRAGVLLNSGDSIERLAEVDRIIFDKTGTLTLPELDVVNSAGVPKDVFDLAGRLALASHHLVAAAVARASNAKSPLAGIVEEPGQGVRGIIDGEEGRLGRPSFCDGLNDAPSLAAAHVSMSPISATHLSQATADLVFLGKPLTPVVAAIDLSRKALRLMRQNLWLAVGYNLLAVPIAIAGFVTPLVAAASMSGSSLLLMLNALRARRAPQWRSRWKCW